jgi:hypothetical protein
MLPDPTENHDLIAQFPEKVRELQERYAAWERECHVLPWEQIVEELARFRAAEKEKKQP